MVTIFFRYAKFCGVKTEAGTLDAFRDAASVSDYAREAMGWAVKAGLVKGDGQDLMPKATASRATGCRYPASLRGCRGEINVAFPASI